MMKLITIDQVNSEYFDGLISKEKRSLIGGDDMLCMGAVSDNADAVGTALFRLEDAESCRLLWLYVAPDQRRKEIGASLWQQVKELLLRHGLHRITYMATDADKESGVWDFLASQGMKVSPQSYEIPTTSAKVIAYKLRKFRKPTQVKSLADLPTGFYADAVRRFGKKAALYRAYPEFWSDSEKGRRYSYGTMRGSRLESIVLCTPREQGDGLIVFDMGSAYAGDVLSLLEKVSLHAMSLYGNDALVTLFASGGVEKKLSDYYGGQQSILRIYPCIFTME